MKADLANMRQKLLALEAFAERHNVEDFLTNVHSVDKYSPPSVSFLTSYPDRMPELRKKVLSLFGSDGWRRAATGATWEWFKVIDGVRVIIPDAEPRLPEQDEPVPSLAGHN